MDENKQLIDELKRMDYEPLEPVEKKLIAYSLIIGLILLIILVFISYEFFPTH